MCIFLAKLRRLTRTIRYIHHNASVSWTRTNPGSPRPSCKWDNQTRTSQPDRQFPVSTQTYHPGQPDLTTALGQTCFAYVHRHVKRIYNGTNVFQRDNLDYSGTNVHRNFKLDDVCDMPTISFMSVRRQILHIKIKTIIFIFIICNTLQYEPHCVQVIYDNVRDDKIKLYRCTHYCGFTHHCSMRSPFSCPLRPSRCHEDVLPINRRGTNLEVQTPKPYKLWIADSEAILRIAAFCVATPFCHPFLRKYFDELRRNTRWVISLQTLRLNMPQYASSYFSAIIAMNHAAIRVESVFKCPRASE